MSYRAASELRDGMRIDWDAAGELRAAACHSRRAEGEAKPAAGKPPKRKAKSAGPVKSARRR
jgi:hypothetical protein